MPFIGLDAMPSALGMRRARAVFTPKPSSGFPRRILAMRRQRGSPNLVPAKKIPRSFWKKFRRRPRFVRFDEPIPVAAADRWARAQALRGIAFDSSAEQELKNAYFCDLIAAFFAGGRASRFRSRPLRRGDGLRTDHRAQL